MNWLLIVLTAGNFSYSNILHSEASCEALGKYYQQQYEDTSFICMSPEAITETLE